LLGSTKLYILKHTLLLLTSLICFYGLAQTEPSPEQVNSHEAFIVLLSDSKDAYFDEILAKYDSFIAANPNNIVAKIERCKFIGNSYWDEYEDYNLKYEETEECIANLYTLYPEEPKVLIYRAENAYGEERFSLLKEAEVLITTHSADWSNLDRAAVFELLGSFHSEEIEVAYKYNIKAQGLNDSLDLSIPLTEAYLQFGKKEKAKATLLRSISKDTSVWKLSQKANLLLKVGEPEKAMSLFDEVAAKDSAYINNSEMATLFKDLGQPELGRTYLVKDTTAAWNKLKSLQNLFSHDLEFETPETALETYRSLQQLNGYDDFFGLKRFQIFLKSPFLQWNISELFHFALLFLLAILLFLLPYLWILPIQSLGRFFRKSKVKLLPNLNFNWTLRHFWIISFLYLLAQIGIPLVLDYESSMSYMFDLTMNYDSATAESSRVAEQMVFYIIIMSVFTLFLLNKKRIKYVYQSNLGIIQTFGLGIGFVIFNLILIRFLDVFIDLESNAVEGGVLLSAKEEVIAILRHYNFWIAALLVAFIVPIYEEIMFRGIILASVEKHIGFWMANAFQAALFATIHFNFKLLIFYFFFGFITGYVAKRTGGLLTGIVFHAFNNFLVLVAYQIIDVTHWSL